MVSSDDDFETVPEEIMRKKPKLVRCIRRIRFPSLKTRTTPYCLFESIKKMNRVQKAAVRELGFGQLLELNIREIPGQLAYWVVDHFHARSCRFALTSGERVQVTEDDV